jgi:hypothetical protein
MVVGRRHFTLRNDLRGVLTVTWLGLVTLAVAGALMGVVLLLARGSAA